MNRRGQIFKIKQQGVGYNRNRVTVWVEDYGIDAVSWMLENGYLKRSEKRYRGENPTHVYYEFTFKGVWLHRWHECTVWDFFYYYVFHLCFVPFWFRQLRNRISGKRNEYDGVDLDLI